LKSTKLVTVSVYEKCILSIWAKQNYDFATRPSPVIPGENFSGAAYTEGNDRRLSIAHSNFFNSTASSLKSQGKSRNSEIRFFCLFAGFWCVKSGWALVPSVGSVRAMMCALAERGKVLLHAEGC
jgi:hypothetical protein